MVLDQKLCIPPRFTCWWTCGNVWTVLVVTTGGCHCHLVDMLRTAPATNHSPVHTRSMAPKAGETLRHVSGHCEEDFLRNGFCTGTAQVPGRNILSRMHRTQFPDLQSSSTIISDFHSDPVKWPILLLLLLLL